MTPTKVEFTSYVDRKGYKIVPPKRPPRNPGQTEFDWILGLRLDEAGGARIVGLGGRRTRKRIAEYPRLFLEFADVKTPEELLKFITEYGSLTKENEIPQLIAVAAQMKKVFQRRETLYWTGVDMKAHIFTDGKTGALTIAESPARLIDALWLQLAHAMSGGDEVRRCEHCGDWFAVGRKGGRRLVARFCSDEHRVAFNSLERTRRKKRSQ
jgi:hypothetical protein